MKRIIFAVFVIMALMVATVFAQEVPAAPAGEGLMTKVQNATAKLKIDGFVFAGKLYSVATSTEADLEKINLTTKKGSYLLSSEIGVRYGMVRPFIGYEAVTKDYEKKTLGLDIFLYDAGKLGAFGIRTAYSETKRTDIDSQKFMYTGVLWKF